MHDNNLLVQIMSYVLLISASFARKQEPCVRYSFSHPSSNRIIYATENTRLVLRFHLEVEDSCPDYNNRTAYIRISHPNKTTVGDPDFCILKVWWAGGCVNNVNNDNCLCSSTNPKGFIFNKTVTKDDSGNWTWRSWDDIIKGTTITLEMKYPPKIKQLSITNSDKSDVTAGTVLKTGTRLLATCSWERGHPDSLNPSHVQLLDFRGVPLYPAVASANQIKAAFFADCVGNESITCFVPGTVENMTTRLQVTGCEEEGTQTINTSTERDGSSHKPTDRTAEIIGGTAGAFTLIVIVCVGAFVLKRISGTRAQLPPPPTPCTMRRRPTEDALFRRELPEHPQDRDTFGSDHTHFYFDIDDDSQSGTTSSRHISSNSTILDCQFLDFIACPSSDSSSSEIEFQAKDCEEDDCTTSGNLASATSHLITADSELDASVYSSAEETTARPVKTAGEGMKSSGSPPSGIKLSPGVMEQGMPTPDDYLHPTASQSKAAAVPSDRVASETSATLTAIFTKTKKPPRLPSDYLHPTASPFEGNTDP